MQKIAMCDYDYALLETDSKFRHKFSKKNTDIHEPVWKQYQWWDFVKQKPNLITVYSWCSNNSENFKVFDAT